MTEILKSLLTYLDETEAADAQVQQTEGFLIESIDQANYFTRKLIELREQKEEIRNQAKEQVQKYVDRVEAWEKSLTNPLEFEEQRIISMLKTFTEQTLEGSSKRSIKLIEGTLALRSQAPSYEYNDEVAIDCLKRIKPELVSTKTVESIDKNSLKKQVEILPNGLVSIEGNTISGITVEQRPDLFTVK